MNTLQKIYLGFLQNPFLRLFSLEIVVNYLIRKLSIDPVSFILRQPTFEEVMSVIAQKLNEKRDLLSYDRLGLCRKLRSDGLMSEKEIGELENSLLAENKLAKSYLLDQNVSFQTSMVWGEVEVNIKSISSTVVHKHRPSLLPWERDPQFFKKNPKRDDYYRELAKEEQNLAWYTELWRSFLN